MGKKNEAEKCETCNGAGVHRNQGSLQPCVDCGGDGEAKAADPDNANDKQPPPKSAEKGPPSENEGGPVTGGAGESVPPTPAGKRRGKK